MIKLKLVHPVCTVEHNVTSIRASKSLLQENERGLSAHSAPALGCTWALTPACPDADKAGDLVVALSQVTGRWTWPTFKPVKGPLAVKTRCAPIVWLPGAHIALAWSDPALVCGQLSSYRIYRRYDGIAHACAIHTQRRVG